MPQCEKLVFERGGQKPLKGTMWVADGMVTVTSEDGRRKTTQVKSAAERQHRSVANFARIALAKELERQGQEASA